MCCSSTLCEHQLLACGSNHTIKRLTQVEILTNYLVIVSWLVFMSNSSWLPISSDSSSVSSASLVSFIYLALSHSSNFLSACCPCPSLPSLFCLLVNACSQLPRRSLHLPLPPCSSRLSRVLCCRHCSDPSERPRVGVRARPGPGVHQVRLEAAQQHSTPAPCSLLLLAPCCSLHCC